MEIDSEIERLASNAADAMRDGTDREVVEALVALGGAPPKATIEVLAAAILLGAESQEYVGEPWLPSAGVVDHVVSRLQTGDTNGVLSLAGGDSYDELLTLLVAVLASLSRRPGASS